MTTTSRIRQLVAALAVTVVAVGCAADPESAKQAFVKSGDGYIAEKKFNEAIIQYRNAIQKDPKFGEARRKLAEAYLQSGDIPDATREYVRAADLLTDREDVQTKATSLMLLFGEFADAKTRAQAILAKNPKSADGQILLGSALAGLKDLDGAVKEIEEAIKIDPVNGRLREPWRASEPAREQGPGRSCAQASGRAGADQPPSASRARQLLLVD